MMTKVEFIQRAGAAVADVLEASGIAPWGSTPAPAPTPGQAPASTATGGERAAAIFFQTFGQRNYIWAELPDLERQAWGSVAAMLTGGAVVAERERDACARMIEVIIPGADLSQRQLLVYLAAQIRARR